MAEGNIRLGKVAFVDKGTYSSATTYNTFDFITTDDSCYLCIKDGNKGHALTETTWWKCIARGTTATAAAKKAEDAAKLANEKATAADSAAGKAVEATNNANAKANEAHEKAEEAKKLDLNKSIRLFSQTTKSLDEFQEIVEYFKQHISPEATFEYYDTICRQVANRMPKLREFAATHDLIFFVSGKKSSNGKMLFEECLKVNANSHLIDNEKEIDPSLLQNVKSIGVCGATSTPKWLMEKIYNHIRTLIKE